MNTSEFTTLPCGRKYPKKKMKSGDSKKLFSMFKAKLDLYVQAKKLNRSDVREKILETIVSEAHHFRTQELLERVNKRHPDIGRATLYRSIPVFVESGILQAGPADSEGQALYELADEDDHHDHIVCLDCQKVFEFHDESIEKRQNAITENMKFAVKDHKHVIYAKCEYLKKI